MERLRKGEIEALVDERKSLKILGKAGRRKTKPKEHGRQRSNILVRMKGRRAGE